MPSSAEEDKDKDGKIGCPSDHPSAAVEGKTLFAQCLLHRILHHHHTHGKQHVQRGCPARRIDGLRERRVKDPCYYIAGIAQGGHAEEDPGEGDK